MRRLLALPAAAALALAFSAPAVAACGAHSWVAGTVDLCRGTLTYRDYVDDDYGADSGSLPSKSWGSLALQSGDQRYPDDAENSADIVGLDLWTRRNRLHVRFRLSALYKADQTVGALAIDTDDNQATGGGVWPGLGVSSKGWELVRRFDRGDPQANVIEGEMPLPPGDRWRVQAVTAQKGGPVMNVAFRGTQESGAWWEGKQAAALRDGDISAFGQVVGVADLRRRVTRPAPDPGPGFYERVYTSRYTVPPRNEGYTYDPVPGRAGDAPLFAQDYELLGRYQPYGIYVPKGSSPHGLQLVLHGSGANFSSLVNETGMQRDYGEARNRIILVPSARGRNGFYSDYSERDVLDAMADVERTYGVDRSREFSGGYSMGGYGTLRLAELFPDRFAGYSNWVGFTGDDWNGAPVQPTHYTAGAIGNTLDFAGNLRYVPGASVYAGADELVHVWTSVNGLLPALKAANVPFVFYLYPAAEHLTFAIVDDWHNESGDTADATLVRNPARVTFRTAKVLDAPALGIRHDRAYWVHDIRPRGDGFADTDLTTHGCGGSLPVVTPRPDGAGPSPLPWTSQSAAATAQRPVARERLLEGTLHGVASLTVDAAAACLARRSLTLDVTTDGPVHLAFSDGRAVDLAGAGEHRLRVRAVKRAKRARRLRRHR